MPRLEIIFDGKNTILRGIIKEIQGDLEKLESSARDIKFNFGGKGATSDAKLVNAAIRDQRLETAKLKTANQELANSNITLKNNTQQLVSELQKERIATEQARTAAQKAIAAAREYALSQKQAKDGTADASGSYREAQQRLTAMGKAIREAGNGFQSKLSPEIKKSIADYRKLNEELKRFDSAMGNNQRRVGDYRGALRSVGNDLKSLVLGYASIQGAIMGISAAYSAAVGADSTRTALGFIFQSSAVADQKLQDLQKTAERLGLNFVSLADSYKSFIGAAVASNFPLEQAEKIFIAVSNAGAKLRLSSDQMQGALLALQQMISKGNVQSEELRGQLGERLPGAFAIAARAMGVTESKLSDMLKKGEVLAADLLPKLANELDKTFGNDANEKIESLSGSMDRLRNVFTTLISDQGAIGKFFKVVIDGITGVLKAISDTVTSTSWSEFYARLTDGKAADSIRFLNKTLKSANLSVKSSFDFDVSKANGQQIKAQYDNVTASLTDATKALDLYNKGINDPKAAKAIYSGFAGQVDELRKAADLLSSKQGQLKLFLPKPGKTPVTVQSEKDAKARANAEKKASDKIEKIVEDSNSRALKAGLEDRALDLENIRQYYAERLGQVKKGSSAYTQLQANQRAEIVAVNKEWDAKDLEEQRKGFEKSEAEYDKHIADIRDQQSERLQFSLQFQRRLNESLTQSQLRQVNDEYKLLQDQANAEYKARILKGENIEKIEKEIAEKRLKLQEGLFDKIEAIEARDREMKVSLAFDGNAFSMPLEAINQKIQELRRGFEAGSISAEKFKESITKFELQQAQLTLLKESVDGISGSFGNLFGDVLFNGKDALQNFADTFQGVIENAISGLAKLGVQYLINQAISKSGLLASTVASKAAGVATASAWAPAASLAATATFGAAAIAGQTALLASMAATRAIALTGFSQGGYTGNMGRSKVAGVVHGQEYVINADAARRNMGLLSAINDGRTPSVRSSGIGASGSGVVITPVIDFSMDRLVFYIEQTKKKLGRNG